MWYINHFSEELTATMTLSSGRTKDDVEHCIYKRLLGAKHGDSGLDNADWQDSCLEEQTVGTVGRALCVLVSDFLAADGILLVKGTVAALKSKCG